MYKRQADILHQVAGAAGLGMFEACQEKGALGIGVDADQRAFFLDSKPEIADVIITSMLKRNDIAMYNLSLIHIFAEPVSLQPPPQRRL